MRPIKFKEANVVYAKNQPEYLQLPVYKAEDGEVISCWKMSFKERLIFIITGKIWISVLTFNKPLQPIRPSINNAIPKEQS